MVLDYSFVLANESNLPSLPNSPIREPSAPVFFRMPDEITGAEAHPVVTLQTSSQVCLAFQAASDPSCQPVLLGCDKVQSPGQTFAVNYARLEADLADGRPLLALTTAKLLDENYCLTQTVKLLSSAVASLSQQVAALQATAASFPKETAVQTLTEQVKALQATALTPVQAVNVSKLPSLFKRLQEDVKSAAATAQKTQQNHEALSDRVEKLMQRERERKFGPAAVPETAAPAPVAAARSRSPELAAAQPQPKLESPQPSAPAPLTLAEIKSRSEQRVQQVQPADRGAGSGRHVAGDVNSQRKQESSEKPENGASTARGTASPGGAASHKRERPPTPASAGPSDPAPAPKRWRTLDGWFYQAHRGDGLPGLPKAPDSCIDPRRGPGRCWWRGCRSTDHNTYFQCPHYWEAMANYKGQNFLAGLDPRAYHVRGY